MLAASLMSYIRFFVLLSPIIIPTMAIFGSLFNANFKGFVYILGLTIAMLFAGLIAPSIGALVPGKWVGTGDHRQYKPAIDAACNLIGASAGGWGTKYAAPGSHALLLAFTATYLMFPMFLNGTTNLFLVGGLIFLLILSAAIRISYPMLCPNFGAVVAGWGTGFIFGAMWYFAVITLAGTKSGLTYFEVEKSDRQQCKLDKKSFRCRRTTAAI